MGHQVLQHVLQSHIIFPCHLVGYLELLRLRFGNALLPELSTLDQKKHDFLKRFNFICSILTLPLICYVHRVMEDSSSQIGGL